jgi:carbon-monoxide dehydrogenase catalytic subunit
VLTTSRSNRISGATHIPFDPEHPETLDDDAVRIARTAIEAFGSRDRSKTHIPAHTTQVMAGFTRETVLSSFGSVRGLLARLRDGDVRGVVAMVGCSTPKIPYETGHVTIARELIRQGVLVLTSGCSAHALLNAGLCSTDAAQDAAPGLREACEAAGIPPVLVVGSCADNARIIQVFGALAYEAEIPIPRMPFAVSGPELAHEKTMGQTMAVLAHGVTVVVGLTPALPIPTIGPTREAAEAGVAPGHNPIADFFEEEDGLQSLVGARLLVRPEPASAAEAILGEIDGKRQGLGWELVDG